jgi:copper(I)-binding protein
VSAFSGSGLRRTEALLCLAVAVTFGVGLSAARRLDIARPTAAGAAGTETVTGAWAPLPPRGGDLSVYLTLHNSGNLADLVLGVESAGSTTAGYVVPGHLHTLEEIENAAECGSSSPADVAASARQLATTSDLLVPAHGSRTLGRGTGRLLIQGAGPVRAGQRIPVTLYFISGVELQLSVPVQDRTMSDPLSATGVE